jgi:hypothetical protein
MTTVKSNIPITQDMKQAAKNVFMAMAFTKTIRPIVEGYQQRIIDEIKPEVKAEFQRIGFTTITKPKDSYLMNDTDFHVYLKRCNEERIKSGLRVESDDYCPLLVAEDLQRQAEHAFIESMVPITHLTPEKVLNTGLDNYEKLLDLSLRLLAPYVKK